MRGKAKILANCCVVTPVYQITLSEDELASLRSINDHLSDENHFTVVPKSLNQARLQIPIPTNFVTFPDQYFSGVDGYNRLLLSRRFYNAFKEFNYMLIVQLDALVLSSQLQTWCRSGWDYVGAPWAANYLPDHSGAQFVSVGNGGFSLRNIKSCLKVLRTKISPRARYDSLPRPQWWPMKRLRALILAANQIARVLPKITVESFLRLHFAASEDIFWGKFASMFDENFRVAPVDEALKFAFETDPAGSYERCNHQLPFGCHAWAKYDRGFWERVGVVPSSR